MALSTATSLSAKVTHHPGVDAWGDVRYACRAMILLLKLALALALAFGIAMFAL